MSKFFAGDSPFIFMTSCEKLILGAACIFPGIRTIIVIFNFTLAFIIILQAAFFWYRYSSLLRGVFGSSFQHQNRSADVALLPNR